MEKKKVEITFVGGQMATIEPDDLQGFIEAITSSSRKWVEIDGFTINSNNVAFFQVLV